MKGIVIASHGKMAEGLLDTVSLFFNEPSQIEACCLSKDDSPDFFIEKLKKAMKNVNTGDGVIVLCDILSGTPFNCIARIMSENRDGIKVIVGVNLPLLLQLMAVRENDDYCFDDILNAGKDGIIDLDKMLNG